MVTPLEESILDIFYKYLLAIREKKINDADKIYEKIPYLLEQVPQDSKLYLPFLLMKDAIVEYLEYDKDYESIASAYNQLTYKFNKQKYPDKYKE